MEAPHVPVAPPPPVGEELHEVQERIQERLRRTGRHGDALADPASFQRRIVRHLQRMSPRYIFDVDVDKAEDVLLHLRILDECADPDKRPFFLARHIESITVPADYSSSDDELDKPCQGLTDDRTAADDNDAMIISTWVVPLHEIIFCSLDKPKLLSQLSELLDEVGLHIRELHLYCTNDGFCLAIIFVDGWETEETDGLIAKIYETVALKFAQQSNSTNSSTSKKIDDIQQKPEIQKLTGTC